MNGEFAFSLGYFGKILEKFLSCQQRKATEKEKSRLSSAQKGIVIKNDSPWESRF